jgi:hypothetical protein
MSNRKCAVLVGRRGVAFLFVVLGYACFFQAAGATAQDRPLRGFSFIERIVSSGAEPVYQVDGYQVRIAANADEDFRDSINSVSDVHPGTWLRFSGKRGKDGIVLAEKVTFYPEKPVAKKSGPIQMEAAAPAVESLIDSEGNFKPLHTKVRLSDAGGWCGWHRIPPESERQARVRRVGNRLLPRYMKQLAEEQSLPEFRFFVVEEKVIRSELACNSGLVLLPDAVLDRLDSDDQLAAILADGIAFNIQSLRARLIARDGWLTAAEVADLATWAVNPMAGLAANGAVGLAAHEHNVEMELERGRLALSMMADAGYDPGQAPEGWKLLGPKHLPRDLGSLKYPRLAQYQLTILHAQYNRQAHVAQQQSGVSSGEPVR